MKKEEIKDISYGQNPAPEPVEPVDWQEIFLKLLLTACRMNDLRTESRRREAIVAKGVGPEDLAQNVIQNFLQGRIRWVGGSLFSLLKVTLLHDYLDLVRSREAKTTTHSGLLKAIDSEYQIPATTPISPEEHLLAKERLAYLGQFVADKPELLDVFKAITEQDLRKPAEIAVHLGTSVEDIYARFKRLRRALTKHTPIKK